MHIRCPHCHNPIDVVNDDPSGDVSCPSCGSCFNLAEDLETARFLDTGGMLGHFQLLDRLGQGAFGVALSPAGKRVAFAGNDQTLKIWDATSLLKEGGSK